MNNEKLGEIKKKVDDLCEILKTVDPQVKQMLLAQMILMENQANAKSSWSNMKWWERAMFGWPVAALTTLSVGAVLFLGGAIPNSKDSGESISPEELADLRWKAGVGERFIEKWGKPGSSYTHAES